MSLTTSLFIYVVFALGAAGLYLALPQRGRWPARSGFVVLAAALAALLIFCGREFVFSEGTGFYFYVLSAIALAGGARVITHPKPVYSAVFFVVVVLATAGLLLLLRAEFVAVALVIIYAGAIMVTYLFVIMLAQQSGAPAYDVSARQPLAAVVVGFLLMATVARMAAEPANFHAAPRHATELAGGEPGSELAAATGDRPAGAARTERPMGNTLAIGAAFMSDYVLVLELAGVLLLVAMVGAIALVRRKLDASEVVGPLSAEPPPPGTIGREVDPF